MWLGSELGTFDPTGQQIYANWPGELMETLGLIAIEVALLYLILRPWSYTRSWGRALMAGLLLAPFAVFAFGVMFMYGSLIALMHVIWLGLVAGGLFVAALVSASAAASETTEAEQPG